MITEKDVLARWESIANDEERILFVAGGAGSGKSALLRGVAESQGWPYIEAKEVLTESILEIPKEERAEAIKRLFTEAVKAEGGTVIIDSVQVLFAPILNVQPIAMFKEISQEHPLLIGWRGTFKDNILSLEHHAERDYFEYKVTHTNHVLSVD